MKNKFLNYFSKISTLNAEESEGLVESMQTKAFKKGEFLLRAGQLSVDTYFILEGWVREYILTDGEEKTTNFFTEEQWVISSNATASQNAANHN